MGKRPNILFIISDQHNAKCLGCYGHVEVKTPNLDRLVGNGVRFTSAITPSSICTPSRMSYFSGQFPHNHGYYGLSGEKPLALPTILKHFRSSGYRTAAIGKIHCPENWIEPDADYFREAYTQKRPGVQFSSYDLYLKEKGLLELRDDDVYPEDNNPKHQSFDGRPSKLSYADSVDGWCVQEAKKFIQSCGTSPWFMQVSLPRPHELFSPAKEFWDLYPDPQFPPNWNHDLSLKAPHMKTTRGWFLDGRWCLFEPRTYEAGLKRKLRGYYGCITQVDFAVGKLLEFLKKNNLYKDTVVIYTSDHGDYACEFGLAEKAPGICSDAITRVPYIWSWPGHFKPGVCEQVINAGVDLSATVTKLAGLPEFSTGDGKDLSPLLTGEGVDANAIAVTEGPLSKSIRKQNWRLVYYPDGMFASEQGRVGELYNLAEDPWEMKNLFYDPNYQNKVMELKNDLMDWLVKTSRVATILNPVKSSDPAKAGLPPVWSQRRDQDGKIPGSAVCNEARKGNLNYL